MTIYDKLTLSQNTDREMAEIVENASNVCIRTMILSKFEGVVAESVKETQCGNCTEVDICKCTRTLFLAT